jgi:hypothetical protein
MDLQTNHIYIYFNFNSFTYSYNDLDPLLTQQISHNAFNLKIWLQHMTHSQTPWQIQMKV